VTLQETTALVGLVFGLTGSVLGVVNAIRDRRKVRVTLSWDLAIVGGPGIQDSSKRWGIVRVVNVGRRPVYVSHVALRLPKGTKPSHLILRDAIGGERLDEGDPPKLYQVDQDHLPQYAEHWRSLIAQVSDSTGKEWTSKPTKLKGPPSWARTPTRTRDEEP